MVVDIALPQVSDSNDTPQIYLEGMKGYPNPKCLPNVSNKMAHFKLSLEDFYECGVTRVTNKITVIITFLHLYPYFWSKIGIKFSIFYSKPIH